MRVPSVLGRTWRQLLCVTSASLLLLAVVVPADAAVVTLIPYQNEVPGYRAKAVEIGALQASNNLGLTRTRQSFNHGVEAAFGDGDPSCSGPLHETLRGLWLPFQDVLLRKTFSLASVPTTPAALKLSVTFAPNVQIWINGVDVSGGMRHWDQQCAVRDNLVLTIPNRILVAGTNLWPRAVIQVCRARTFSTCS